MNIQIGATGKTIYVSTYHLLFTTKNGKVVYRTDEEIEMFYQDCMADDLGNFVNSPFSDNLSAGKLEVDDEEIEIPEIPLEENPDI